MRRRLRLPTLINSGEPDRSESAAAKQLPFGRWWTKLSLILFATIVAAAMVLWVSFLIWLAIRMIIWIVEII
jgi:hypothetical protein